MPKVVDHRQRRQLIAAALMRVASRDGLEGISLRHVATEAGVTSGMVQHYFPTKDELMHYALETASERFSGIGGAEGVDFADLSVQEHIIALMTSLLPLDERRREAGLATVVFAAYAATHQGAARELASGSDQLRAHLYRLLRSAAEAGLLQPGVDAELAASVILGATDGLGFQCLTATLDPHLARRAVEHQVKLLFAAGNTHELCDGQE